MVDEKRVCDNSIFVLWFNGWKKRGGGFIWLVWLVLAFLLLLPCWLPLASSYRYGLTEGSPATKLISLTSLGSSIVAPTVGTDVKAKLREALLHPDIFRTVYSWMDRKPIPREDVFRNTLMKPPEAGGFAILKEDVDDFVRVFNQNIADYG